MTQQPDALDGILAVLDERAAALQDVAGALRRAQAVFAQPFALELGRLLTAGAGPAPVAALPPASDPAPQPRKVTRKPRERATMAAPTAARPQSRQRSDRPALRQAIEAYLDRVKEPATMAALVAEVGTYAQAVRTVIDALVAEGSVIRTGTRNSLRIGRPAVMGRHGTSGQLAPEPIKAPRRRANAAGSAMAADPPPSPAELRDLVLASLRESPATLNELCTRLKASVPIGYASLRALVVRLVSAGLIEKMAGPNTYGGAYQIASMKTAPPVRTIAIPQAQAGDTIRLASEINRVLKSGASYDVKEIRRNISAAFPVIDHSTITDAVESMVAGGRVERIPLGSVMRYRQVASRRESA